MLQHEIVIIGGGPAGMAAAVAARKAGIQDILILERDSMLGGILNQCIHNGFGLHTFKEELTGPEYAARYVRLAEEGAIPYRLNTMVVGINGNKVITAVSREEGLVNIQAGAIILAMGCRERPRGALNIPGYRPAGIYSAGTAQRLMNMEGFQVGRSAVILGSGDIGLIMARRLTLEGAQVKAVAELMPYSGGLKRNIVQCLDDYGIPLKLSHTVVGIHGKGRVTGVTLARVDGQRRPIRGSEEYYSCDTLLLSVGLLPENELTKGMGAAIHPVTAGPEVDDRLETGIPGVFACGNVLHVHDLVDYVSEEADLAGRHAADYVRLVGRANEGAGSENLGGENPESENPGGVNPESENLGGENPESKNLESKNPELGRVAAERKIPLVPGRGIRYTVPQKLGIGRMEDAVTVRFRVADVYQDQYVTVRYGDQEVARRKKRILAPGEMEQVVIKKASLAGYESVGQITISLEPGTEG